MTTNTIMTTNCHGFTVRTTRNITKGDMISLCNALHENDVCKFQPEPITEGGIMFIFQNPDNFLYYKTVRFHLHNRPLSQLLTHPEITDIDWPRVYGDVMEQWCNNDDIVFYKDSKIDLYLKSMHGAPVFTIRELKTWVTCLNQIGIVKTGKYPTQRSLVN